MLGTDTEAQDMARFFFTRKYYKYNKSSRSNRSTKKGYWKITGKERGNKRTLTFYQDRVPKSNKTSWVIHEYYLPGNGVISYLKQAQGDFVICHLMIKSDKKDSSLSNEGEPGSAGVSNCENQAADEMNQEGREELLFHQPQPQDERCSSALRSLASQELEAVLQTNSTNDDCSELQSPFVDGDSCLLDGNEVSTCDEYETLYDVFPQLCDPPEENLDSHALTSTSATRLLPLHTAVTNIHKAGKCSTSASAVGLPALTIAVTNIHKVGKCFRCQSLLIGL